ncbi:thiamine phosphate synthase [Fluviicola taffensis]|uniref:Thiamine monophosphate synthase n=1 Tax=Fluviicola taffensis (strain DSM 16823 / NCIMB 13979 / RW262) TaxID=755732 RepID=F2IH03_FLUTR|nr:thiamine phosphate synthase [Fluviicola taffensis]AEA44784.1 thiamine monophosphate synthase [Fluviicola taffensis DSM 16823]
MLIVISDSDFRPDEAVIVNELFQAGLDLFHIRKYGASEEALLKLVDSIDAKNYSKLVLHHDHEWGKSIGLNRFHYSEKDRKTWYEEDWKGMNSECIYSTSVHSVEEYNELANHFSYAFLSPVFDSISKSDYKAVKFDFSKRQNKETKLIGLGGIQADNVNQAIQMGFDGAALLGAIWNNPNPINEWKLCRDVISQFPLRRGIKGEEV